MNLTILSHPRAVCVQARFTDRDDAIRQLTQRLTELGKITDADAYLAEVFHRESLGPTALGEGLAVPHGKSSAVKEAAFAVATLSEPMDWEGIDGPESVEFIFLLAIPPDEAGSTHIQILTELTTCLADEGLRARVMAAAGGVSGRNTAAGRSGDGGCANDCLRYRMSGGHCAYLYGG